MRKFNQQKANLIKKNQMLFGINESDKKSEVSMRSDNNESK